VGHLDARTPLFVISGPSGAGKGTAIRALTERFPLRRIATYTTRSPREHEVAGVDYNFVSEEEFFRLLGSGAIAEYTRTYSQSLYGSPSSMVTAAVAEPALTELDPGGFVRVRAVSRYRVVGIFVTATSEDELRQRLITRGQGDEVAQRLRVRTDQLTWAWVYDYVLVNDDRDAFLDELETVVRSELIKTAGAQRMLELKADPEPPRESGNQEAL
jgi:guanylate kinase